MSVSVISACKDRTDNLLISLRSWLVCCSVIREIVIVDWGSLNPIDKEIVSLLEDMELSTKVSVIVIRVDGEAQNEVRASASPLSRSPTSHWSLSTSFNLALRHATQEWILKLDADHTILDPDALWPKIDFDRHDIFYTGNWQLAVSDNDKHLNGVIIVRRAHLLHVQGYSEYIQSYGWDDSDLYHRLVTVTQAAPSQTINTVTQAAPSQTINTVTQAAPFATLQKLDLPSESIHHIKHSDLDRTVHSATKSCHNTFSLIHYNRFLSEFLPWRGKMSLFHIHEVYRINYTGEFKFVYLHATLKKFYGQVSDEIHKKTEDKLNHFIKVYSKFTHRTASQPKSFNFIFAKVRNGLGNKLRTLGSVLNLFRWLNDISSDKSRYRSLPWKLVVIWIPDHHCEAKFEDLILLQSLLQFRPGSIFVHDEEVDFIKDHGDDIANDIWRFYQHPVPNPEDASAFRQVHSIESLLTQADQCNAPAINLVIDQANVISFPSDVYSNWNSISKVLQTLQPVQPVLDEIERLMTKMNLSLGALKNVVGVHIRQGQPNLSFDDTSGWDDHNKASWKKWRDVCTPEVFSAKMIELHKARPELEFYICSDNDQIPEKCAQLLKKYAIKAHYINRDLFDRSKDQVLQAYAEVILLSRCNMLLLSNWSSYSELAGRLSQTSAKNLICGIDFC